MCPTLCFSAWFSVFLVFIASLLSFSSVSISSCHDFFHLTRYSLVLRVMPSQFPCFHISIVSVSSCPESMIRNSWATIYSHHIFVLLCGWKNTVDAHVFASQEDMLRVPGISSLCLLFLLFFSVPFHFRFFPLVLYRLFCYFYSLLRGIVLHSCFPSPFLSPSDRFRFVCFGYIHRVTTAGSVGDHVMPANRSIS